MSRRKKTRSGSRSCSNPRNRNKSTGRFQKRATANTVAVCLPKGDRVQTRARVSKSKRRGGSRAAKSRRTGRFKR